MDVTILFSDIIFPSLVVLKDLNSKLISNQNISHLQECCRSSSLMKFTLH